MAMCHSSWDEYPDKVDKTAKQFKQAVITKIQNEINQIVDSDSHSLEYIQGIQHVLNIVNQEKD